MTSLPTRFRLNTLSNYANSVVTLVLAIAVTPILVRGLGKDAYGTWALVTSTVVYLDLLKFGFGRATVKYVAESRALGDHDRIRRTLSTSFFSLCVPAIVAVALTPGIAFLFPLVFDVPDDLRTAAIILVCLSAIDLAIAIPADTFGGGLIGYQRYELLNVTLMATALAQAAAWAVLLALGGGLVSIGAATLTLSLVAQISRWLLLRHLVGAKPIALRFFDRSLVRPLLAMSGWIAVTDLAVLFIARADTVVVGAIGGVGSAAVYSVGQKLSQFAQRFTSPVVVVFFPHAAELAAREDREGLRNMVRTGTRLAFGVAAPLTITLGVLAEPTLDVWVGPGYRDAQLVVVYLAAGVLISTVPQMGVYVLRGMGDVKVPAVLNILEAALNMGLSIALGLLIGIEGVALATLISIAIAQFFLVLPYACRKTQVSMRSLLVMLVRAHALPAALTISVGFALRETDLAGLLELGGAAIAIFSVYLLTLLFTGLNADERRRLLHVLSARVQSLRG